MSSEARLPQSASDEVHISHISPYLPISPPAAVASDEVHISHISPCLRLPQSASDEAMWSEPQRSAYPSMSMWSNETTCRVDAKQPRYSYSLW